MSKRSNEQSVGKHVLTYLQQGKTFSSLYIAETLQQK